MKKKVYEFSVIASGLDPTADDFETRFDDAGCDDATVSFQRGHIIVDFASEADSIGDAIAYAVSAIRVAGANVDRIEPDPLVSLSEIAARTGMTRAAMTQYSKAQRSSDFPAPVAKVTSNSPLWDWSTVARWFFEHQKLSWDVALEAEIVKQANAAIQSGETDIRERLRKRAKEYA
jgi:predicted DNA-binding transcriptional regulator AlpA